MKNRRNIIAKVVVTTFVFTGAYLINIQYAKADTTLTLNKGVTLQATELKPSKTIKAPESQETTATKSENTTEISRGLTNRGIEVVNYAYNFLGKPYVYGASGPNAFDCSGLTQYVYNRFGIGLSRTTYTQVNQGIKVDRSNLQPGDLVFFNTEGSISHVGIYVGGGDFIHAPRTGKPVMISSLSDGYYSNKYATARRILN